MIETRLKAIKTKDLLFVVLYTALLTIGVAVLLGLIDFMLYKYLQVQLGSLMFWGLAFMTGNLIRKQYETPHLAYSIITGLGLLLAAVIIEVLPIVLIFAGPESFFSILFDLRIYWDYALQLYNPVHWVVYFDFNYLITLLMIAVGTYLGVKRTY